MQRAIALDSLRRGASIQAIAAFAIPALSCVIATKLIIQMPANAALGLPSMMATLLVLDKQTGELKSVIEATALTNLRTAAVSAVAVRKFTKQNPLVVTLIGSGALARTHAQAIRAVRR